MLPAHAVIGTHILILKFLPTIFAIPLQLNLPILLDSTLLSPTTSAIINTTFPGQYSCFDPHPTRLPTTYEDCASAVMEMNKGSDTRTYTFGRGSHATYTLPKTFYSGTCSVTLDMVYDDQLERLTLAVIQDVALRLALRCAIGPIFNLGGVAAVSPKNVLYVTVVGRSLISRP